MLVDFSLHFFLLFPLAFGVALHKTIKEEFTEDKQISFSDFKEAKTVITRIINFYNNERPHRSLDMYTPRMAYQLNKVLKRRWKTYYKDYSKIDKISFLSNKEKSYI